jgi:hypothetical protein
MVERTLRFLGSTAIACFLAFAATPPRPADAAVAPVQLAAKPAGDVPGLDRLPGAEDRALVRRIQEALSRLGLYQGPAGGTFDLETESAIRAFQKQAGLPVDGRVSEALADNLETQSRIQNLLHRLEQNRRQHMDAARAALLANPATRDLVTGETKEAADPTRDSRPCFLSPTARCLLAEASESAKAIFKDDLRDWARGEILVAQAKAGLAAGAMESAKRISDPRLVMVALRDIAEAQAAAGRGQDALAAADIIPDILKQAEAFASIADIQARRGDAEDARAAVRRLLDAVGKLKEPLKRAQFRARAAVVLAIAGEPAGSRENLEAAEAAARSEVPEKEKSAALRYVAAALAEMERPDRALALLKQVREEADRTPVLISAANAQVRAGDAAAALATADSIEEVRYRALVLARVAVAQAEKGDGAGVEATLQLAHAAAEKIKLPFARSYALSKLALALADIGRHQGRDAFVRAGVTADAVEDARLRAETLWLVAAQQRRSGDGEGALRTEARAEAATRDVISQLSRVWMFSDLAVAHAGNHDPEAAWSAFYSGLKIAQATDNAWSRARALAKLAQTLIALVEPVGFAKPAPSSD